MDVFAQPWDMSVSVMMDDELTVMDRGSADGAGLDWLGLAGHASTGSCASCVFYVGGSGRTVLLGLTSALNIVFRLLAAPAVNP